RGLDRPALAEEFAHAERTRGRGGRRLGPGHGLLLCRRLRGLDRRRRGVDLEAVEPAAVGTLDGLSLGPRADEDVLAADAVEDLCALLDLSLHRRAKMQREERGRRLG